MTVGDRPKTREVQTGWVKMVNEKGLVCVDRKFGLMLKELLEESSDHRESGSSLKRMIVSPIRLDEG